MVADFGGMRYGSWTKTPTSKSLKDDQ
jgi:hypothetical protein